MGIENFFIHVKLEHDNMDVVDEIIKSNRIYNDYINYSFDPEDKDLCLCGARVCFFPICLIMYDLLKEIDAKNHIVSIDSRKNIVPFEFESSFDFFCWMYKVCEESMFWFHRDWGAFLINATDYYKVRNKLSKKYFIKFPSAD